MTLSEEQKKRMREALQQKGLQTGGESTADIIRRVKESQLKTTEQKEEKKGVFSRAGTAIKEVVGQTVETATEQIEKRSDKVSEIKSDKKKGFLEKVAGTVRQGVGFGSELLGGIGQAGMSLGLRALPGDKEKGIEGRVREKGREFIADPGVQGLLKAGGEQLEKYGEFKERHPFLGLGLEVGELGVEIAGTSTGLRGGVNKAKGLADDVVKQSASATKNGLDYLDKVKKGVTNQILPKQKTVEEIIDKGLEKGIRPSVVGKKTVKDVEIFKEKGREAVKIIVENKKNLKWTDADGLLREGLPESLNDFGKAIEQTKKSVFEAYDSLAKQAGEMKSNVQLKPIAGELRKVVDNKVLKDLAPNAVRYAKERIETLLKRDIYTPEEAQEAVQILNKSLEVFYKNPSWETASSAAIDALIANNLRGSLDNVIEKATGEGYQALKNKYGALKAIEKDVTQRAIVDARKNVKGLLDFTDIFTGGQIVEGLISLSPGRVISGVTQRGIKEAFKYFNDPNTIIKRMFKQVDDLLEK